MAEEEGKEEKDSEEDSVKEEENGEADAEEKEVKEEEKSGECEVFEVERDGKKEEIRVCVAEEKKEEKASKVVISKENKILSWVLVVLILIIVGTLVGFWYGERSKEFEYRGIDFRVLKDKGGLMFYHTLVPSILDGQSVNYNIYLRKDPRKTAEIPFDGRIATGTDVIVLDSDEAFHCDGDGVVAIGNFVQIFGFFDTQVGNDREATCDPEGKYTYIYLKQAEESSIKQTSDACYEFNIADCEILDVTERYILDALANINSKLK